MTRESLKNIIQLHLINEREIEHIMRCIDEYCSGCNPKKDAQFEEQMEKDEEEDRMWEDDEDDPLESLAENCTCGAYVFGKNGIYKVSDCIC